MMELYPGLTHDAILSIPTTRRYRLLQGKEQIERRKRDAEAQARYRSRGRR